MKENKKIKTVIIDDNQEFIDALKYHLSLFHEIELSGHANNYEQAINILTKENLDVVFLDIEMPYKNGFELLKEARLAGAKFSVIFCTAYDKYGIQALRETAFDYILKPVRHEELKDTIERYKEQHGFNSESISVPLFQRQTDKPEIIALPTNIGVQLINFNRILMFRSVKSNFLGKSSWEVELATGTSIKLAGDISAQKIMSHCSNGHFFQISQSCIVNLSYLNIVEYKTHQCILFPPFDKMKLTVSRAQLSKLKERFETL